MKRYRFIVSILALLTAGIASADEADTLKVVDVEEVLVIAAPKENRKLREQPVAVTLLSQQDIQNSQVNSIKKLTGLVPNMFIPDYGSRLTSAIYIRGIGSRINTPSIGLYVDNMPYIDKSAFDFSYADVERIDVLRGPQGTLYGRNAMGGLIKIHTKSPFSYQGTDFRMGAGTRNAYNKSITHYHRVSEHFAFSAGGFYDYQGGFFRNSARNEKADKGQSAGGRIRAIYLPSENWKIDLNVSYEYSDQTGYPYFYMGSLNPEKQNEALKPYVGKIANNERSSYHRNLLNTGLNLEYQARNFTLSAVTGYQFLKDRMFMDQDFTPSSIFNIEQKQKMNTLSEEIILKSKPGRRWQWTTGAFGLYQWLHTEGPVVFHKAGIGNIIENNVNRVFDAIAMQGAPAMHLDINNENLRIGGSFDTPVLSGALFHQSAFNDLFVKGLSATIGLR
ncbi:MAG: TonB-dependent receptor plug domain-containing protein, partial [Bacteroides sp.]|nr:TonB-dependent receptor plug domain-containing protein [Bacteroides sp.]